MLIQILLFLLKTAFSLLIAAALLRAWMNWLRVSMTGQPGRFVMALTDWLVKPLRRALPASLGKARVDWGSVIAAALLALGHALLSWLLISVVVGVSGMETSFGLGVLMTLPVFALKLLLWVALQTLFMMVLGYAILSWVQPGSAVYVLLARLTEPLLAPIRRVVPAIGGVDLSALVLLVVLQICQMALT
ncbi:MAG: hypothetical protein JWR60_1334 [Polaromonas sp.]|nr:hypothetical protein [Polaromonas sp.]